MTAKCICYGSGPHSQTALEKEAHAKGFGVGPDATSLHFGRVRKSIARRAIASATDGFISRQIISSAGMTGDLRQIPLCALTVSVRLRAELAPTQQAPAEWEVECMWCATFATIT
jgi:hypothetical protein